MAPTLEYQSSHVQHQVHDCPEAQMVCPECGATIVPETQRFGSMTIMILLFLCGIWPGVLYAVLKCGVTYNCPQCHADLDPEKHVRRALS